MHNFTNSLINETSPYLLQHAHNPVNWFAWGNNAFNEATSHNKPVLVSIGYSACHWCHVMERESFENEATARYMNEHFVNIKIDREERPDIDHIYMDAVQAMTGSGGWPLNVFLLPDGRPFFGGTYFPPARVHNRASWLETLQSVNTAFTQRRTELEGQAGMLTEHIKTSGMVGLVSNSQSGVDPSTELMDTIAKNLLSNADTDWGGFGGPPKFPQTFSITFLLRHFYFTGNEAAKQQALLSVDKMIYGGIYDQLGGGFARYSTDEKWLAPHFEKMLYDNALLVSTLCEAYQLTGNQLYAQTIRQTLHFILREMTSDEGGFYCALDADSEGVEGKFYTWSRQQVEEVLGYDADLYCRYYNIVDQGNWEHTNILWVPSPPETFVGSQLEGDDHKQKMARFTTYLQSCNEKLFAHRAKRIRPGLDDKILLSWNALMNTAFCNAYAALGDPLYLSTALINIGFIENKFFNSNTQNWYHTFKNNEARHPAFLEDLAFLTQSYIQLQEVTGNAQFLFKAREITGILISQFKADDDPYFYFTSKNQSDVIIRKKEVYDGAIPSGNSVMACNLLYLANIFNQPEWHQMANVMLAGIRQTVAKYPTSFGKWAAVLQGLVQPIAEIAVVGKLAHSQLPGLLQLYIPNKVLQASTGADDRFPLLANKPVVNNVQFYLCRQYMCLQPVATLSELSGLLKK